MPIVPLKNPVSSIEYVRKAESGVHTLSVSFVGRVEKEDSAPDSIACPTYTQARFRVSGDTLISRSNWHYRQAATWLLMIRETASTLRYFLDREYTGEGTVFHSESSRGHVQGQYDPRVLQIFLDRHGQYPHARHQ